MASCVNSLPAGEDEDDRLMCVALLRLHKVKLAFISSAHGDAEHAVCCHHVMQHHVLLEEESHCITEWKNI